MHRHLPDYPGPSMRDYYEHGNPDDAVMCDCGHRDFEEEISEIDGKTVCVNCAEEAKPCLLCGKLTTGSIGAAGIRWAQVCQPCKDSKDFELSARIKAESQLLKFVSDKLFGAKPNV